MIPLRFLLTAVGLGAIAASCSSETPTQHAPQHLSTAQCAEFEENGRVTICHATGSLRNPIVVLRISESACISAHSSHPGDRIAVDGDCGPTACLPAGAPHDATLRCCDGLVVRDERCVDLCAGVACGAVDQCHVAGTCDPSTGACSNPPIADGTVCADGNACTQTDVCTAGLCTGSNPVVCAAADGCHVAGTCEPATGACSNPGAADGTSCDDQSLCTAGDVCTAGSCGGATVPTDDHNPCTADACTPGGGVSHTPLSAGTACGDTDLCNGHEVCNGSGACGAGTPTATDDENPCTVDSCDAVTGLAVHAPATNGTSCDDGSACTRTDACNAGVCTGGNPVVCNALDQCHAVGTCDPMSGACSNPAAANGTGCDDGNGCTQTDTCSSGACTGGTPVVCAASDACHVAGLCNPAAGTCTNPVAADGTSCGTGGETCQSGSCARIFNASTNLSTTRTQGSCSGGGDMFAFPVTALSPTTATLAGSPNVGCFSVGDSVLLINLQGTPTSFGNVGNFELLTLASISGSTVTFTAAKTRFYGSGAADDLGLGVTAGSQRVMLQRVPTYPSLTIAAGAQLTARSWNGVLGGVFAVRTTGAITGAGSIVMNGAGFRGGASTTVGSQSGVHGESYAGLPVNYATPNFGAGSGGCGESCSGYGHAGGGAGYALAGGNSSHYPSAGGGGGSAYGDALLSRVFLGSGGGAGGADNVLYDNPSGGAGGPGGGIVLIFADSTNVAVSANGGAGAGDASSGCFGSSTTSCWDYSGPGGGGSGGSILRRGTVLGGSASVLGGAGGLGSQSGNAGAGSAGRLFSL
ncbi:MAG: hypothetical protein EPO40_36510 [Myxococcaceae bacterium]|nr:MAG: hypothetical protein EPO40_36510 [Myxococcaceae bacterium]